MELPRTVSESDAPSRISLSLRSAALFAILLQVNLIAGELSDSSVFISSVLCAFAAGIILAKREIKPLYGVLALLAAPVAARFLIAFPRLLSGRLPDLNIILDSLLLEYDRNTAVSCAPFYYAAISTLFSARSRASLRNFALGDCAVIVVVFSFARSAELAFYKLPVVLLGIFGVMLFAELVVLMLAMPKPFALWKREAAFSCALLAAFALSGGALLFYEAQKGAFDAIGGEKGSSSEAAAGNGLLKAGLFSFDMTPNLNLFSEVTMNSDLVFIVRKEKQDDKHIFMRRFILSAYNSVKSGDTEAGFSRDPNIDEKNQRSETPAGTLSIPAKPYEKRTPLKQEYYIKNIDGAAFLAMNEPSEVTPFENYDSSSFKTVFGVESLVTTTEPSDLYRISREYKDDPYFGLSAEEYAWYTRFATSPEGPTNTERRIEELTRSLVEQFDDNFAKIIVLLRYLSSGDYRYSLKPGIAADGDQLAHFLFESKRGYCSYFALAYASMLRAAGIPCRIALGFYLDPETERMGFYPIRSGNAHAWVEIFFPHYGWIEFDPTTEQYAEDELQLQLGGEPGDGFEQLMKEILENRANLKAKSKLDEEEKESVFARVVNDIIAGARSYLIPVLAVKLTLLVLLFRFRWYLLSRICGAPRRKTIYLWRHILFRLRLKGYKKPAELSETEWVASLPCAGVLRGLYDAVERARYAEHYTIEEAFIFVAGYKDFSAAHGKIRRAGVISLIFLAASLVAQDGIADSNALYESAENAALGEYWERAVTLYTQGKKDFPDDWRFPMSLGDLYFNKQMFILAKEEFLAALKLIPDYAELMYKLALCTGSLNEYEETALYFEQYLNAVPDDWSAISELGWVYFKLHRLQEGRDLISKAIDVHGMRPHLAMTLGTIYSSLMDYEQSAKWYSTSIKEVLNSEYGYGFAATAYYNYAILESRFYSYGRSLELAQKSLEMADRDTGHMMRAELYLRRLDWQKSFDEYSKAFAMDKQSPLPKMSLAQVYLITGRLEEARLYAEDCYKLTNHSWMFRFGIDPAQYARDVHDILNRIYLGLYNRERARVYGSLSDRVDGEIQKIKFYFKYRVHKALYEKNALRSARSYNIHETGGQYLDALADYYAAFKSYRSRALFYVELARDYEVSVIPNSEPGYLYETGKLKKDTALIESALERFDAVWERDMSAEALAAIASGAKRHSFASRRAAQDLYALNPGAPAQNGITLPAAFTIDGGTEKQHSALRKALTRAGFDFDAADEGFPCRLSLSVHVEGDRLRWSLSNGISGASPLGDGAEGRAAFANAVHDLVFRVR